jgi:hypothetical protein
MLSFLQYLAEAIEPHIYNKVLRDMEKLKRINNADVFQWNEGWMEKEFRESPLDKDKKAMRLFIPHGSAVKIRIIRLFNKYDLKMLSYKDGTVKSPDPKASHPLKIGAVLTNLVSNSGITKKFGIVMNNNEDKKEATELLRLFAKDSANRNIDDGIVDIDPREEPKWIVISRDPYDVAGMSTGREWSSCQDLEGGGYCHYVPRDILAGTLAAYLIKDSDKREVVRDGDVLRLPLSRLLIKPYLNNKGETAFAMSAKQYTKNNRDPIFPIVVKKWVDEFNRKRGTKGFFTIHPAVYMGHKGGTGEISATKFEIDDEGNMVNAGKPEYYKPDRFIRNVDSDDYDDEEDDFEDEDEDEDYFDPTIDPNEIFNQRIWVYRQYIDETFEYMVNRHSNRLEDFIENMFSFEIYESYTRDRREAFVNVFRTCEPYINRNIEGIGIGILGMLSNPVMVQVLKDILIEFSIPLIIEPRVVSRFLELKGIDGNQWVLEYWPKAFDIFISYILANGEFIHETIQQQMIKTLSNEFPKRMIDWLNSDNYKNFLNVKWSEILIRHGQWDGKRIKLKLLNSLIKGLSDSVLANRFGEIVEKILDPFLSNYDHPLSELDSLTRWFSFNEYHPVVKDEIWNYHKRLAEAN